MSKREWIKNDWKVKDFDAFIKHLEQDVDKKMLKSIVDKLSVEKEQVI